MERQPVTLTPEYAEAARLPIRLLKRHVIVGDMLDDPYIVGSDYTVWVNEREFPHPAPGSEGKVEIHVTNRRLLMGRDVLRKVAVELQRAEQSRDKDN